MVQGVAAGPGDRDRGRREAQERRVLEPPLGGEETGRQVHGHGAGHPAGGGRARRRGRQAERQQGAAARLGEARGERAVPAGPEAPWTPSPRPCPPGRARRTSRRASGSRVRRAPRRPPGAARAVRGPCVGCSGMAGSFRGGAGAYGQSRRPPGGAPPVVDRSPAIPGSVAPRGYFSSRDIRRSASGLPPVWQVGQYCSEESAEGHLADRVAADRAGLAGAAVHAQPGLLLRLQLARGQPAGALDRVVQRGRAAPRTAGRPPRPVRFAASLNGDILAACSTSSLVRVADAGDDALVAQHALDLRRRSPASSAGEARRG